MILYISDNLIDSRNNIEDFCNFLKYILLAYKEGKHIVSISPKKINELLKDEEIIQHQELFIMLNAYNTHAKSFNIVNLEQYFNVIIIIDEELNDFLAYSEIESKIEYRKISYKMFLDSDDIQKTILLGENAEDIEVYVKFADYFKQKNKLNSFTTKYKKRGGGGNTTNKEYESIYEEKSNFCLCILDSDKKFPLQEKYGDTAKFVLEYQNQQVLNNNLNFKMSFIILDALELENLLPKDFYLEKYPQKQYVYDKIEEICIHDDSFRKYFDFKKGIVCRSVYDQSKNIITCKGYLKEYLCPLIKEINYFENTDNPSILLNGFQGKKTNILKDFSSFDINDIIKFVDNDIFVKNYWDNLSKYISSHILIPQIQRSI